MCSSDLTELHRLLRVTLGLQPDAVATEYGMSELSSQAYATDRPSAPETEPGELVFPPWCLATVIGSETGAEVPVGGFGRLRLLDLANLWSVSALQTEDLAREQPRNAGSESGSRSEVSVRNMIGWSAGLVFRNEGGVGMPGGSNGITSAIAVCTSTAAPSMLRSKLNCSVTEVLPVELVEIIESTPAMVLNWRSSTVATEEAIVAGSAPGSWALTVMVGNSTFGRSLTPSARYAITPKSVIATITRLVAMGRRIKISEIFTNGSPDGCGQKPRLLCFAAS